VLQHTRGIRLCSKFHLDWFILSPSVGEKPQFLPFFGLRHLVLPPTGSSLRKLDTGALLQTFPYRTVKIVFVLQRLHCEIGRTISDVDKPDGQTDRHTDKTRHRASTSMYSLTFCIRVMLPEHNQWKPVVQAAAVMLRTTPRRRPVTGQPA